MTTVKDGGFSMRNKNCTEAKEALVKGKELIGDKVYEIILELEDLDKSVEKCKNN